ncbi:MAG: hypothetical protein L6R38_001094 [Xanthoria sp. 2 TBL-2021]|nr:MAG: hypothetical protein L6R38_001094 [Xanthoria sp. 2 TBL-2021]
MATSRRPVGISPPPLGEMANFENPETQAASNIALHTVMLFFVTLCVTIRIYTRFFITRQLGLDDYIGMICSCLLAFPAFIDRYGPGLISRFRSYSNLLKSSTRGASSTKLQRDSNDENRKTSVVSAKDQANLTEEAGSINMHTTFPEAGKPSYQSSYRGKLEHMDIV